MVKAEVLKEKKVEKSHGWWNESMPRAMYKSGGGACKLAMKGKAELTERTRNGTYYSKVGDLENGSNKTGSILRTSEKMAHTRSVEEVVEKKKKLSKMRSHCKSKMTDVQRATCGCRKKKNKQ